MHYVPVGKLWLNTCRVDEKRSWVLSTQKLRFKDRSKDEGNKRLNVLAAVTTNNLSIKSTKSVSKVSVFVSGVE